MFKWRFKLLFYGPAVFREFFLEDPRAFLTTISGYSLIYKLARLTAAEENDKSTKHSNRTAVATFIEAIFVFFKKWQTLVQKIPLT